MRPHSYANPKALALELQVGRGLRQPPSSLAIREIILEMTSALILRSGLPPQLPHLDAIANARLFQQAESRFGAGGATLREIACEVLDLTGTRDPLNTPARILAAFSTASGTEILIAAVSTVFTAGFAGSGDTTKGWVNERELTNFKTNRRPRVGSPDQLDLLPRNSEAGHAALDLEASETYRAARFAKQFIVDQQDAVSQDLDAILQPALLLGRAASRLRQDLVYAELLANAPLQTDAVPLFDAAHANVSTTAALSATTLDGAIAGMTQQTENGAPVNTVPRYLLVPPGLAGLAYRLVRDMTTDAAPLLVRSEPRLGTGLVDPRTPDAPAIAGSATSWYLACDNSVPTIEFGFRTPQPVIDKFDLTQGQWGFGFNLCWDVGAKVLDYRGLHQATA